MTDPYVKLTGDAMAVAITGATLVDWLPPVAAILTILYTALRIWESRTVQGWFYGQKPKDLPSPGGNDRINENQEN